MREVLIHLADITISEILRRCLKTKYLDFSSRAQRKEFWYFIIFSYIFEYIAYSILFYLYAFLILLFGSVGYYLAIGLGVLIFIFFLIPQLAVFVRRLHDLDRSGWWALVLLIPTIGLFVAILFGCLKGSTGTNKYGENPLIGLARERGILR